MLATLRARIALICMATVGTALVATCVINYTLVSTYESRTIANDVNSISDGYATSISQWVEARTGSVSGVGAELLDDAALDAVSQLKDGGGFSSAYVGYPNHDVIRNRGHAAAKPGYDPTVRPWYQQAVKKGSAILTAPYVDANTGGLVVTFANPILSLGLVKAVVGADIKLDSVISIIANVHPTPASFAFLIDKSGTVIAYPNSNFALKPVIDISKEFTSSKLSELLSASTPIPIPIDGAVKLLRAKPILGSDWMLVIALDETEAKAGVHAFALSSLLSVVILSTAALIFVSIMLSGPFKRLSGIGEAMKRIASSDADLTQRLPVSGADEVANIATSFNLFASKINNVLTEVRTGSSIVSDAALEIAEANQDLSARTEAAASALQETAASMEQIHGSIRQSAESIEVANRLALSASSLAAGGGDAMQDVVTTMEAIARTSRKASEITSAIDGIAFQTNILALNAAVEAARAGDSGRGFAVVAAEVRALAQRSAVAAKEIKVLLDESNSAVVIGNGQVSRAGKTMKDIISSIGSVDSAMKEIAAAVSEQTLGVGQVGQAVSQLDETTQRNAALVEETAAATQTLRAESTKLADVVAQFKLAALESML